MPATGAVAGMGEVGGGERGWYSFGWYLCHLVFPDGRTTQVRSDCPVGAEPHVSRSQMALPSVTAAPSPLWPSRRQGPDRANSPRRPKSPDARGGAM